MISFLERFELVSEKFVEERLVIKVDLKSSFYR
jgi:hypothetical protein